MMFAENGSLFDKLRVSRQSEYHGFSGKDWEANG